MNEQVMYVNGREVKIENEENLLQLVRKANIEMPTFCYHSELSVYGACRLCIVDIEGRGIETSCTTKPAPGMRIKTHTKELREIRKMSIELLLANHDQSCQTCAKTASCKLQKLAGDMGIDNIRFRKTESVKPVDLSSDAIVRDPNKCILCGDCVRACYEIQDVGAIDFSNRGSGISVSPAFGKNLSDVECVDCGQCARVCPTGAITPKQNIDDVWNLLDDPAKTVVAQVAPAVRVAIGEQFGIKPGTLMIGQIVAALKMMGFDKVYDTSFAADLTTIEETNEFINRITTGKKLPLFTSCCPAWVKFAEQYHPELLENLSTCKSPQQMFGSVAKEILPEQLGVEKKDLVVVSIMPCTAKKVEANKPEFKHEDIKEVDFVLTTQELGSMIKESGINFSSLAPESLDLPMGFKTGAGVIFGNSGGVSESVLRYAYEKLSGSKLAKYDFTEVRGNKGIKECSVLLNGAEIKLAVVSGLKNANRLIERINSGEASYDIVEVMACPGGCVGGAGQPVCCDEKVMEQRTAGLYNNDKMLQVHKPQENPYINDLYRNLLIEPGSDRTHELLHTDYQNKKRILQSELSIMKGGDTDLKVDVKVCVGTNCFVKSSQALISRILAYVEENGIQHMVDVSATFCMEKCSEGPNVLIDGTHIQGCTYDKAIEVINGRLNLLKNREAQLEV